MPSLSHRTRDSIKQNDTNLNAASLCPSVQFFYLFFGTALRVNSVRIIIFPHYEGLINPVNQKMDTSVFGTIFINKNLPNVWEVFGFFIVNIFIVGHKKKNIEYSSLIRNVPCLALLTIVYSVIIGLCAVEIVLYVIKNIVGILR